MRQLKFNSFDVAWYFSEVKINKVQSGKIKSYKVLVQNTIDTNYHEHYLNNTTRINRIKLL